MQQQSIRKFLYIVVLILLSLGGVIYFSNVSKLPQEVNKSITANCSNLFTDEKNNISFCLPSNYIKVSNENKDKLYIASFTPMQNSSCSAHSGSYCYVLFFNYYIDDTEAPSKWSLSVEIGKINETFQTDLGEIMTMFSPFHPSIGERVYSYKLKNGRYAYFDFIVGHPKQNLTELNNHLKILKSVKQI